MATWGLHMRIAEEILNKGYNFDEESFAVGNIGPDCGVPNEDWSKFYPSGEITHWKNGNNGEIEAEKFFETYIKNKEIDLKEKSFLVGYYIHLLTDIKFSEFIDKKIEYDMNYTRLKEDKKFIWIIKKDWYDLDHLYFKENPNSIFFRVFQHIKSFPDYLDYFPKGATIRQVRNITDFYLKSSDNLDREYKYLTMEEMDSFVNTSLEFIKDILNKKRV